MNGVRPPETVPAAVRRQWREERHAAHEASQRRDALERMSPRERQLAAIAESRYLADVATERAAVAIDPIKKTELETLAADLRRQAKRQERDMPAVDTTTPATIRGAFTEKAAAIRSEFDGLAADDGREATWKNGRRSELVDALDVARQTADRELLAWATKAGKHLA
jgi:hypothetical protein